MTKAIVERNWILLYDSIKPLKEKLIDISRQRRAKILSPFKQKLLKRQYLFYCPGFDVVYQVEVSSMGIIYQGVYINVH